MSDSSSVTQENEFVLVLPKLIVFGDISTPDEEGEKMYNDITPHLGILLSGVKLAIETKFPNVRVGYDI